VVWTAVQQAPPTPRLKKYGRGKRVLTCKIVPFYKSRLKIISLMHGKKERKLVASSLFLFKAAYLSALGSVCLCGCGCILIKIQPYFN
jgi:hypothetical protein